MSLNFTMLIVTLLAISTGGVLSTCTSDGRSGDYFDDNYYNYGYVSNNQGYGNGGFTPWWSILARDVLGRQFYYGNNYGNFGGRRRQQNRRNRDRNNNGYNTNSFLYNFGYPNRRYISTTESSLESGGNFPRFLNFFRKRSDYDS